MEVVIWDVDVGQINGFGGTGTLVEPGFNRFANDSVGNGVQKDLCDGRACVGDPPGGTPAGTPAVL